MTGPVDKSKGDMIHAILSRAGDDWAIIGGQLHLYVPVPIAEAWARRILDLPDVIQQSDIAAAASAVAKAQRGQP
ncbi:MAG: hypothetical protein HQL45_14185 [Alphaproteobacteria bacterium]|nr:hypothetical protein [Alphaproteobacteria bacterium]